MTARAADMLAERDACRPGSDEWEILNLSAWRIHIHELGGLLSDTTPPPADFGPHYLEPQMGIAAE